MRIPTAEESAVAQRIYTSSTGYKQDISPNIKHLMALAYQEGKRMTLEKVRKKWAKANTDSWDNGKDLVVVFDGELKKMEAGI